MKKHLFGLGIFSFIFVSFAVAFAYLYAPPIPQVAEVKLPVYQSEPRTTCHKKSKKLKNIEHEVISSQYFYDENRIISKLKLTWNGGRNTPQKVFASTYIAGSNDPQKRGEGTLQYFDNLFAKSDTATVTLVTRISGDKKFDRKENLYAAFSVSDEDTTFADYNEKGNLTETTQVVFVHGENSKVKKQTPILTK